MNRDARVLFWLAGFVLLVVLIDQLSAILLPFVAGMAVAYFLDPVADKLEAKGCSRGLATTLITLGFFAMVIGVLSILLPLLQHQIVDLVKMSPDAFARFRAWLEPYLHQLQIDLPGRDTPELRDAAGKYASKIIQWVTGVIAHVWSGGLAFVNLLSLLLITPLVSFYLLREWDHIVAWVDSYLPRSAAEDIRQQARLIDATMAGFIRGQATVCLSLATIYGVGLTFTGLHSGLLVGVAAGMLSFVPYFGCGSGMIVAGAIAVFQFGTAQWGHILAVACVFGFGQVMESYVLTPRLVGDKVGLHPLWIIFALMAGGALFGFTGVLLAVPTAAVIGVLVRYALGHYKASDLYDYRRGGQDVKKVPGDGDWGGAP